MKKKLKFLTNGLVKENPVLRLVLGTCPTLAVTTAAFNGIGMGLAATAVLLGSNVVISLLRNFIPKQVRIPAYITVIAGFVTAVQMIIKAFAPAVDKSLGIFLPLIVVNCIILGRAEMFASKHGPLESALDALGMGAGFTAVLLIMGSIREILGAGTFFGFRLFAEDAAVGFFKVAPGGFLVFGLLMALANFLSTKSFGKKVVPEHTGCEGCINAATCGGNCESKEGGKEQ